MKKINDERGPMKSKKNRKIVVDGSKKNRPKMDGGYKESHAGWRFKN